MEEIMDDPKPDTLQEIPGLGKIRTVSFLLLYKVGRILRRLELQCGIFNYCLATSAGDEKTRWAEALLNAVEGKERIFLETAAELLNVPVEEIGRYVVGLPRLDMNGQRLYVTVIEENASCSKMNVH